MAQSSSLTYFPRPLPDRLGGRGGGAQGEGPSTWQEAQGLGPGEGLRPAASGLPMTGAGHLVSLGPCSLQSTRWWLLPQGSRVRAGFKVSSLQMA